MKIAREQSQKIFREHGVWVNECCDECRNILGPVRYTHKGQPGEWCSLLCRDGVDRKAPGLCQTCGSSLSGKRKGTRFCADVCRKRAAKQSGSDSANYRGIVAHSKGLTGRGRGFAYTATIRAETGVSTDV